MSLHIQGGSAAPLDSPVLEAWRAQILAAGREARPLHLGGAGSKAFYGRPVAGDLLDTRAYAGVIDYAPSELVISARCGTPLAEIEALLAAQGQMLAFEPPRFAGAPTLGGVVAAGLSGPRRASAGAVRDFVLGAAVMDGVGAHLKFGGQVMKNVAGYDVARMLAGSLGCLGIITQMSLKVLPKPPLEMTLQFELSAAQALDQLNAWAGRPLPISASVWSDGLLRVRLSGAAPAVDAARKKIGGELGGAEEAAALWTALRDHSHAFFRAEERALLRISLPDSAPHLDLAEAQLIEWGGAQRWCRIQPERLTALRQLALKLGGHATVFRAAAGESCEQVFTPLSAPVQRIHRALKQTFDPAGIFNRGRMYPEL